MIQAFSKVHNRNIIFFFLKQNIFVGTLKNRLSETVLLSTQTYRRSGVKNLYPCYSHFSGGTKNWITIARSVLYCWKSDRIIFSNIQIHCYWCFEFPIKILWPLWRVSPELRHFDPFFGEKPSSYDILSIFFMAKPRILVKLAPK